MLPKYDLDKIKFGAGKETFEKAVGLYEAGKVTQFKEELNGFFATVLGTKPYKVYVDNRHYDHGDCECYLGQNDTLCKHMVAVAIYAIMGGEKLSQEDKKSVDSPVCSGKLGELSKEELAKIKKDITLAMRYIKPYSGPSRVWFAYQSSLDEGCARLSKLVSDLPASEQTAKLLVDTLLRLDKKLCEGGVDDSDGIVGGFIYGVVEMLQEYVKLDSACVKTFQKLCSQPSGFGWEEPLVKIFNE